MTVKEVKKRRVPELNDEFAKTVGDVETLAALRDKLRQQLTQRKTREQDAALKRTLMEKLVQQHAIEVPEAMVEREAAAVLEELAMTLRATGGRMEGLPEDPEALRTTARETATRRVQGVAPLGGGGQAGELDGDRRRDRGRGERPGAGCTGRSRPPCGAPWRIRCAGPDSAARILERKAMDFLFQHATITDAFHLIKPA